MNSDTALSRSSGWDFTMASCGKAGYSYKAVPLYPHISSSLSLQCRDHSALPLLSLHHLHSLIVVVPIAEPGVGVWMSLSSGSPLVHCFLTVFKD